MKTKVEKSKTKVSPSKLASVHMSDNPKRKSHLFGRRLIPSFPRGIKLFFGDQRMATFIYCQKSIPKMSLKNWNPKELYDLTWNCEKNFKKKFDKFNNFQCRTCAHLWPAGHGQRWAAQPRRNRGIVEDGQGGTNQEGFGLHLQPNGSWKSIFYLNLIIILYF